MKPETRQLIKDAGLDQLAWKTLCPGYHEAHVPGSSLMLKEEEQEVITFKDPRDPWNYKLHTVKENLTHWKALYL